VPGELDTIGHPTALAAVRSMLGGTPPHAVLLAGPAGIGKTTLARDLASGLLCVGAAGTERPCRACRGCRLVAHGNHPDVHDLAPGGAGWQIQIGGKDVRGIRELIAELALLPVEGGWRVAVLESAHRMNDDAQSALLKTLEEPPARSTLILCADDEDRLLPTVRSRCVTLRMGPVGIRDVERIVVERGSADAATGARLARLTAGRPGLALAYAAAPDAETIRGEIVRTLLDLLTAGRADRLTAGRALLGRAAELGRLLAPPAPVAAPATPARRGRAAARSAIAGEPADAGGSGESGADAAVGAPAEGGPADGAPAPKTPAAERRRALGILIDLWRDLARDLAVAGRPGAEASIRDRRLLDELDPVGRGLPPAVAAAAVERLVRAAELLDSNVSPELLVDVLVLRWPRLRAPAA
jgi:DNA polymerase-3 subunit delta'